jgi:hypothetical protein
VKRRLLDADIEVRCCFIQTHRTRENASSKFIEFITDDLQQLCEPEALGRRLRIALSETELRHLTSKQPTEPRALNSWPRWELLCVLKARVRVKTESRECWEGANWVLKREKSN